MQSKPDWIDPFSPEGTREATATILTGMNYRLFYEGVTRRRLIEAYRELAVIAQKHPKDDQEWRRHIHELVSHETPGQKGLRYWLIGLAQKTATNLGLSVSDYPNVFDQMMADIEYMGGETRETALLLWCGAATLTIRGSQKAKIGISLERAITRAALSVIGLQEEKGDFRLDVGADEEVERQTDAEVRTPRGYVRMEVGLIGKGNPEVISDKVGRLRRNDMIIMDSLPAKSTAYQTAQNKGVRLIQLRNNHPVEELREHLISLHVANVREESITPGQVEQAIRRMPLTFFGATQ